MGVIRQLGHCTQHAELTDGCIWCGTAEADLARASGQSTAAVAIHHLRGAVEENERLREAIARIVPRRYAGMHPNLLALYDAAHQTGGGGSA